MYTKKINVICHNISKERRDFWHNILKSQNLTHKIVCTKEENVSKLSYSEKEDYIFVGDEVWLKEIAKIAPAKPLFVISKEKDSQIKGSLNNIFAVWCLGKDCLISDEANLIYAINYLKHRDEEALKDLWLDTILNTLPDFIWFKDPKGIHLDVNQSFCDMLQKKKVDVVGKTHHEIWGIHPNTTSEDCVCLETEDDILSNGKPAIYYEDVKTPDGRDIKLKTWKAPIFKDGEMIGTVGIARDITKEFEYTKNIEQLAHYDQLTGLGNRNKLKTYLSTAKTSKMVIVYMDMDNFKNINDTYGHLIGDNAIKMLSKQIKEQFSDAINIRWGGDEFISIFVDNINMDDICKRVNNFVKHFRTLCQEIPMFEKLSVSAGVAEGQLGHGSFEKLLQKADKALYFVKEKHKGNFYVFKDDGKGNNK